MVRSVFSFFLALLLAFTVRAEVVDIDTAELARLRAAGVPVIDIRTASEWRDSGVVEGSKLITYVDDRGRIDHPAWLAKVQEVATRNQPVIVICRSGNRTKAASQFLSEQAGYQSVYNVKGGLRAWVNEGRPVTPVASALLNCPANTRC
ncbi:rhodanese-like domain-containing protein [Accumulibacter sp.]|uniref:rhodanese-like domain-containing protein n=1 Tax=Accumulibacter sp. TaxID=2053492 RepID=UPI002633F12E|nr:rhodanese-like domain-containing protein [Accumulibacter sp.]